MGLKSGQSQVLTAVMLGGIVVAGIGAAYMWGMPILEKNQEQTAIDTTSDDMRSLADAVIAVAREGGSRTASVDLNDGVLSINTDNDTIHYRKMTSGAYVSTRGWVPLNTNEMQGVGRTVDDVDADGYGIEGSDRPIVLIGQSQPAEGSFLTQYLIASRPLYDPDTGQTSKITLVQDGNLQASGGTRDVVLQRLQEDVVAGEGVDGGALQETKILIRVS